MLGTIYGEPNMGAMTLLLFPFSAAELVSTSPTGIFGRTGKKSRILQLIRTGKDS